MTFRVREDCWVTTRRKLFVESSANSEVTAGTVEYHVLDQAHTCLSAATDPEDVHKDVPGTGCGGVSTNDQAVRVARQDSDRAQE